jgi:hypothetical protein
MWIVERTRKGQQTISRFQKQKVSYESPAVDMDRVAHISTIHLIERSSGTHMRPDMMVTNVCWLLLQRHVFNFLSVCLCSGEQLKAHFICNECGYGTASLESLQVSTRLGSTRQQQSWVYLTHTRTFNSAPPAKKDSLVE